MNETEGIPRYVVYAEYVYIFFLKYNRDGGTMGM